jgi:hypothetical protein
MPVAGGSLETLARIIILLGALIVAVSKFSNITF